MNYDEKIQATLRNRELLDENIANLEKDIERINYDLEVKKQQIIWLTMAREQLSKQFEMEQTVFSSVKRATK